MFVFPVDGEGQERKDIHQYSQSNPREHTTWRYSASTRAIRILQALLFA